MLSVGIDSVVIMMVVIIFLFKKLIKVVGRCVTRSIVGQLIG